MARSVWPGVAAAVLAALQDMKGAQVPFEMTFERCGREAGNLARCGARRHLERPGQLPAEDPAQQFQGRRAERVASPAVPAERAPLGDVESHERRGRRARTTARTAIDYRACTVER